MPAQHLLEILQEGIRTANDLDGLLEHSNNKTCIAQDILKVRPPADMGSRWYWMAEDEFTRWYITDPEVARRCYLQAVELEPLRPDRDSTRFQFQACLANLWPDRLRAFQDAAKRMTERTFAIYVQRGRQPNAMRPYELCEHALEVPVVASVSVA
jgi:hypothetical protein